MSTCGWSTVADYPASCSDEDDTSSTTSTGSALHYNSSEEAHQPEEKKPSSNSSSKTGQAQVKPTTRFGPGESSSSPRSRRLSRNRSMLDVRSQLLHRTLVEELNKRMFFNTVGAVENIGFRHIPGYGGGGGGGSGAATTSSSSSRGVGGRRNGGKLNN